MKGGNTVNKTKNHEPIIAYAEILALAGQSLQGEIAKLRSEEAELTELMAAAGRTDNASRIHETTKRQVDFYMTKLRSVEDIYRIETGEALGYIEEMSGE